MLIEALQALQYQKRSACGVTCCFFRPSHSDAHHSPLRFLCGRVTCIASQGPCPLSLSPPPSLHIYADREPKTFLVFQNSLPMVDKPRQQTSFIVTLPFLDLLPLSLFLCNINNDGIFMIWNVPFTASDSSVTVNTRLDHFNVLSSLQAASVVIFETSRHIVTATSCVTLDVTLISCAEEKNVVCNYALYVTALLSLSGLPAVGGSMCGKEYDWQKH